MGSSICSPVSDLLCFVYFSLCCVYDVCPLMGQVLWKVLLTSRENELTIDGDFRISGLLRFQSYQHT